MYDHEFDSWYSYSFLREIPTYLLEPNASVKSYHRGEVEANVFHDHGVDCKRERSQGGRLIVVKLSGISFESHD